MAKLAEMVGRIRKRTNYPEKSDLCSEELKIKLVLSD
jgi:hypothetical protein